LKYTSGDIEWVGYFKLFHLKGPTWVGYFKLYNLGDATWVRYGI